MKGIAIHLSYIYRAGCTVPPHISSNSIPNQKQHRQSIQTVKTPLPRTSGIFTTSLMEEIHSGRRARRVAGHTLSRDTRPKTPRHLYSHPKKTTARISTSRYRLYRLNWRPECSTTQFRALRNCTPRKSLVHYLMKYYTIKGKTEVSIYCNGCQYMHAVFAQ